MVMENGTYKTSELIEFLQKDLAENGDREAVLKTTGGYIYPNSTYRFVFDPAWRDDKDDRLQIWPNGTLVQGLTTRTRSHSA
jgi:hypothetical protein